MSQTNSASGYPLNYRNLQFRRKAIPAVFESSRYGAGRHEECGRTRHPILRVLCRLCFGIRQRQAGVSDGFHFPTPGYVARTFARDIPELVQILDLYPGDEFNFEGIRRSFLGRSYSDDAIKAASTNFYHLYGKVDACDISATWGPKPPFHFARAVTPSWRIFDSFVRSKVERSKFSPTILGKTLSIILDDLSRHTVRFGTGLIQPQESNKEIFVSSQLMGRFWTAAHCSKIFTPGTTLNLTATRSTNTIATS